MHTTLPSGCGSHVEFLTQSSHGSVTSTFSVYTGVYNYMCVYLYVCILYTYIQVYTPAYIHIIRMYI